GIKQLMFGSIRDMEDGSGKEVITLIIENHETLAAFDVNRFLTVQVLAGVPADRDLRPHEAAAAGREPEFGGNHQSCLVILTGSNPFEIFAPHYARRLIDYLFIAFGPFQPVTIEITH